VSNIFNLYILSIICRRSSNISTERVPLLPYDENLIESNSSSSSVSEKGIKRKRKYFISYYILIFGKIQCHLSKKVL